MNQIQNQTINNQPQSRLAVIDIMRVLLTFIILNLHSLNALVMPDPASGSLMPITGALGCEAFFIISGFFIAKAAYKENPTGTWRYVWRKVWKFLPIFIIALLLSLVTAGIASGINGKATFWATIGTLSDSWFMWFLFIASAITYPLLKRFKNKFALIGIFIAIAMYICLFFLNHTLIYFPNLSGGESFWHIALCGTASSLFRSVGGALIGSFIYMCSLKLKNVNIPKALRIIFSVIGISSIIAFTFMTTCNKWFFGEMDFVVLAVFAVCFFILFTNIGLFSSRITLPTNLCNGIGKWTLMVYVCQYIFIGLMAGINQAHPELINEPWWWSTHLICCYIGGIGITVVVDLIYKPIQKHLLVKFKKLNSI